MNYALPLNEDQRDCLQEITNVAIGAAAECLASFTNQFVCLPIPVIRCVDTSNLTKSFDELELHSPISAISQQCLVGDLACQALMIITDESFKGLSDFTKRKACSELGDDASLLQELFYKLSDTCFDQLSEMFELPVVRQNPILEGIHISPEYFDFETITKAQQLIAIEIDYQIEHSSVSCHMLLLFPDNVIQNLAVNLDRLLN
jgi:chemotaxis protein CheY-P-specific phosphatase CheC